MAAPRRTPAGRAGGSKVLGPIHGISDSSTRLEAGAGT
jgi:hypothetical protein